MHRVPSTCPRVLINLESVGEAERSGAQGFEFEREGARDVRWLGEADRGVEELCDLLGWRDELRTLKEEGWKELDAAEGRREPDDEEEDAEEKREQVVERVGEAAGQKDEPTEGEGDSKDVDALVQAVEGVSLGEQEQEKDEHDDSSTKL